jgi:hypothetical protein
MRKMKLSQKFANTLTLSCLVLFTVLSTVTITSAEDANSLDQTSNMRLKIKLLSDWPEQKSANGPATFCRKQSENLLQVSWAEYRGKNPLKKVSNDELKDTAIKFGQKNGFGDVVESSSETCTFGNFGTAVFRSAKYPRIQVWFITNGNNYILATHICSKEPDANEILETREIVCTLTLEPEK